MTEQDIENLIRRKIESDEKLDSQAGGSGHLSFKSYELNGFKKSIQNDQTILVTFSYTVFVETEFTIYPDNPPHTYHKEGSLVLQPK